MQTNATGSSFITTNAAGTRFLVYGDQPGRERIDAGRQQHRRRHPRAQPAAEQRRQAASAGSSGASHERRPQSARVPHARPRLHSGRADGGGGHRHHPASRSPCLPTRARSASRGAPRRGLQCWTSPAARSATSAPMARAIRTPTANLGYTGGAFPVTVGTGYYRITVCVPASANCTAGLGMPNPPAAPSYTVVATPVAGQSQVNDTQCTAFAVDSTGQQFAAGTGGTAYCWS